jgi:hypothetical protein
MIGVPGKCIIHLMPNSGPRNQRLLNGFYPMNGTINGVDKEAGCALDDGSRLVNDPVGNALQLGGKARAVHMGVLGNWWNG